MSVQKKILVVDDDPFVLKTVQTALEREGYIVTLAEDGSEGLESIKEHEPHLILCDRAMPEVSGYQLLETIRNKHPQYSSIPFVFLTSLGDRRDRLATADLKPTDYLTKPVKLDELLLVVQSLLAE